MTTSILRDQLQTALGPQYTIERELGRGGMATVYLAEDAKHHRSVALKVLHADLAASLGPERFRQEIAFAAKLQHPHILTVLDSGETATGLLWFTMPYVEGESLRDRLRRETQLSVDDAVRITREIASALDYAHQHGVIHRDIKPENVLLTRQGEALLADFGIARALTGGADGGSESARTSLTAAGIAVGTPQYMSPEQASADRALTARSDVYSLGAVAYEMLAGEPPFTGPTPQIVLAKMVSGVAPSARRSRPTVPEAIDGALRKALAPVPADRWTTAGELASALERAERTGLTPPGLWARSRRIPVTALTLGLGFLFGVGALFAWRERTSPRGVPGGDPIRLAVLPFDNVGDSADAYFADGLTDAVRNKLAAIRGLEVIASTSSGQYRHTTKSPRQIAQALDVRYLLVGKVRWAKASSAGQGRVQVSPEWIEASNATDKWGAPFDAPLTDVLQVQAAIASDVAQQLSVALTPAAQQRLAQRPTANLDAYESYLATYSDLGWVLDRAEERVLFGLGPAAFDNDAGGRALVLAQQYSFRGDTRRSRAYADTARAAFEAALAVTPNDPQQHIVLGLALAYMGDRAKALREGERAVALRPLSKNAFWGPYVQHQLARIYLLGGEPEKALDALEPLLKVPYYLSPGWLKIDPNFVPLRGNPRFERLIVQPPTSPIA